MRCIVTIVQSIVSLESALVTHVAAHETGRWIALALTFVAIILSLVMIRRAND